MNAPTTDHAAAAALRRGVAFGVTAALFYACTNVALRFAAKRPDLGWAIWVGSIKALPTVVVAWMLIMLAARQGEAKVPTREQFFWLFITALSMQFGGNICFQYALARGGLTLSVPLCFAAILTSGAILSWLILGERISKRAILAMAILMVAIVALTQGAAAATASTIQQRDSTTVALAVTMACLSGVGYGFGGVMIRRSLISGVTLPWTLAIISTMGIVALGGISVGMLGRSGLAASPPRDHAWLLVAGLLNTAGFFTNGVALRLLPIVRANLINASQLVLAALSGVFFFNEALTAWLGLGASLIVTSFIVLGTQDPKNAN